MPRQKIDVGGVLITVQVIEIRHPILEIVFVRRGAMQLVETLQRPLDGRTQRLRLDRFRIRKEMVELPRRIGRELVHAQTANQRAFHAQTLRTAAMTSSTSAS